MGGIQSRLQLTGIRNEFAATLLFFTSAFGNFNLCAHSAALPITVTVPGTLAVAEEPSVVPCRLSLTVTGNA